MKGPGGFREGRTLPGKGGALPGAGRKQQAAKLTEAQMVALLFRGIGAATGAPSTAGVPITAQMTAAGIAWVRLSMICRDGGPRDAVQAAQVILDRTFGRARQGVELSGDATLTVIVE